MLQANNKHKYGVHSSRCRLSFVLDFETNLRRCLTMAADCREYRAMIAKAQPQPLGEPPAVS